MAEGKIIQVIGPVIDIDFSDGTLPQILNALTIPRTNVEGQEEDLVVEDEAASRRNCVLHSRDGFNGRPGSGHESDRRRRAYQSSGRPQSSRPLD